MTIGIYMIKSKINSKVYIGSSKNIKSRWYVHRRSLNGASGYPRVNMHLKNEWQKYGEGNFEFILLEECTIDNLIIREEYWINFYDSMNREKGYNMQSPNRNTLSEEAKLKISKAKKGHKYNLGKKHSEETKRKIGQAHKGKEVSKETREKLSKSRKGKKIPDEVKRKMSEGTKASWQKKKEKIKDEL